MRIGPTIGLIMTIWSLAPAALAADFTVDFSWDDTAKCFEPKSPPFVLGHVPAGTKSLRFNMVDLDFTSFQHGGGTIGYAGKDQIPQGAFNYRGPCPPVGQHHYEWTVDALGPGGEILATAKAMKPFPPQ